MQSHNKARLGANYLRFALAICSSSRRKMTMRFLAVFLILFSAQAFSDEECIFDENAYIEFINSYAAKNSKIKGKILTIEKQDERISIQGGGCVHLGSSIQSKSSTEYTEEQFLQKVLSLSTEFGDWLINIDNLKTSIKDGKWEKHSNIYFIQVNVMTVFEASYDKEGNIHVVFYIN